MRRKSSTKENKKNKDEMVDIPSEEKTSPDKNKGNSPKVGEEGERKAKEKPEESKREKVITQLIKKEDVLPSHLSIIPLDGKPVIPGMMLPVFVRADKSTKALMEQHQKSGESFVGFVYTESSSPDLGEYIEEEEKEKEKVVEAPPMNLASVGIAAQILKEANMPTGDYHMLIRGIRRFKIEKNIQTHPFVVAAVQYPEVERSGDEQEMRAYTLSISSCLKEISQASPVFPEELKFILSNLSLSDPDRLCDFAILISDASPQEIQEIISSFNIMDRLAKTLLMLKKELDFLKLKEKINRQIEEKINQRQREFFLKEQLKAIKKELGFEQDEKTAEMNRLKKEFARKKAPPAVKKKFEEEMSKLSLLEIHSPEFGITRNYIDWLVCLPWGEKTSDNLDLKIARTILDEDHYGLEDVKDRLIEFLAVGKLLNQVEGSILCFVGPPGVGKTSLGKSIARALGRKFFRFSVGGMHDEAEIKGHRRTYIGAMPGKLIQALRTVETENPVIMLDEIDKIGKDFRGDPSSALLEVLDPEQNFAFRDHYLDVPYDLSKVLFIATANVLDTIPPALGDRMEIIRLPGYIRQEKIEIAKRHLIPKQIVRHGLSDAVLGFQEEAISHIIEFYAREAGVRGLEKQINKIMRKVAVKIVEEGKSKREITAEKLEEYLGSIIFRESPLDKKRMAGVITGLAWTPLGGSVLFVESTAKVAKPSVFKQTGQLGEVMIESSDIAYSYVTSNHRLFGIKEDFFTKRQIHLHVPAGATPKDGPSAGITMATSLISLAKNHLVPKHMAMTGELTLTGQVLPVGGIREKLIAAKRARVERVILPEENRRDVKEMPAHITQGLTIQFVEYYPQVYSLCFEEETPENP